jgi:hypothetical protein
LSKFFKIFHPSGLPLSPHLLCCRAFAVNYYSFTPCAPGGGISQAQLAAAAKSAIADFREYNKTRT